MSRRKGLSAEEKKQKLLQFFQRSHEFYNIKEVENLGSKHTTISSMQIKDVLQELLDDDLVKCEKCGVSNLYWSFASENVDKLNKQYRDLQDRIDTIQQKKDAIKTRIIEERKKRAVEFRSNESDIVLNRAELLTRLDELQGMINKRERECNLLRGQDPKQLIEISCKIVQYRNEIDVYVDNISLMLQYFSQDPLRPIPRIELMKELSIPLDYDDDDH